MTPPTAAEVRRLVLDTDVAMGAPGSDIDDGFAIALAVADPALRLELVTTVDGNTDVDSATALAVELLHRLGRGEVPVVRGAAGPLADPWRPRERAADVLERFGHRRPAPGRAAEALVRHITASPGEITLVAIGPLTNVATAMLLEPRIARDVREIVVMGGYFTGHQGNVRVPGEFNIWADPEAARIVLRSGARLRLVGLDVTYQVRMSRDQAAELASDGGDFGRFAGECGLAWIETLRHRYPGSATRDSFHLHDPLAVAAVTHPELIGWRRAHVAVATDGVARGITVADLLGTRDAPEPNCEIADTVDVPAFLDLFLRRVGAL
ncbi:nucleoside hydrolase [Streptomyces sp. PT12]|uniref:nucleoside hydrolase n=1 Tax=Streptomyces sp. PT12 TaxID=1510197 RepID=UPI000DE315B6|nr:nucleoside hydrolase [Streptomyces sp. PT12]RBM06873.1 ribonucleoside hydrolase [Streptomyces sp. PT12]